MYSSPGQSRDWGKVAWTQEFKASLNSMANLVLEKNTHTKKQKNKKSGLEKSFALPHK